MAVSANISLFGQGSLVLRGNPVIKFRVAHSVGRAQLGESPGGFHRTVRPSYHHNNAIQKPIPVFHQHVYLLTEAFKANIKCPRKLWPSVATVATHEASYPDDHDQPQKSESNHQLRASHLITKAVCHVPFRFLVWGLGT